MPVLKKRLIGFFFLLLLTFINHTIKKFLKILPLHQFHFTEKQNCKLRNILSKILKNTELNTALVEFLVQRI